MGHGLNNTLQDVLIRYNQLMGRDALWVPGMDHAGIATQIVVERQLDQQKLDPALRAPREPLVATGNAFVAGLGCMIHSLFS